MDYTPNTWNKGDLISSRHLNRIEAGIIDSLAKLGRLGVSPTEGIIDNEDADADLPTNNDSKLVTCRAVRKAINNLDASFTGTVAKTPTAISEENGKISVTYNDILIEPNQIHLLGLANGVATLDSTGLIPTEQLPSYVDDILEGYYNIPTGQTRGHFYATRSGDGTVADPYVYNDQYYGKKTSQGITVVDTTKDGEPNKIYVDVSTHYIYRWSEQEGFTEISAVYAKKHNTELSGTLHVVGAATLDSTLATTGAVTFTSTLGVTGNTTLGGTLGVTAATTLSSTLGVTGATTLSSTLDVTGATSLSDTLGVTGATTLSNTLSVTGAATLASTLAVTGATTLTGDLTANGNVSIASSKDLTVEKGSIILGSGANAKTIQAIAAANALGCIKVGSDLTIAADGTLSGNYAIEDSYNSSTNKLATKATVTNAINALDGSLTGSPAASKTLTAFSQTDGVVSATFADIQIANTQVTGLGTAATVNVASNGNAANNEIVLGNDSRLTDARNAADVSAWAKEATKPTYTASEVGALPSTTTAADLGALTSSALTDTTITLTPTTGTVTFTDGTDSVTFTLAELQSLKSSLQ